MAILIPPEKIFEDKSTPIISNMFQDIKIDLIEPTHQLSGQSSFNFRKGPPLALDRYPLLDSYLNDSFGTPTPINATNLIKENETEHFISYITKGTDASTDYFLAGIKAKYQEFEITIDSTKTVDEVQNIFETTAKVSYSKHTHQYRKPIKAAVEFENNTYTLLDGGAYVDGEGTLISLDAVPQTTSQTPNGEVSVSLADDTHNYNWENSTVQFTLSQDRKSYKGNIKVLTGTSTYYCFCKGINTTSSNLFYPIGELNEYRPNSVEIEILGDLYTLDFSNTVTEEISDIEQVSNPSENAIAINSNSYLQEENLAEIADEFSQVFSQYRKGKETATLLCSIGEYYDIEGKKVISTESEDKMTFNLYDECIPMIKSAFRGNVPMSTDGEGNAKMFEVVGREIIYDGALWQKLTLLEKGYSSVQITDGTKGLAYEISADLTYYICTGLKFETDSNIVVASTVNGLPVKHIASGAFEGNANIESLYIPDTITQIRSNAFKNCTKLKYLTVASESVYIDETAFEGTELTNLSISANIEISNVISASTKNTLLTATITSGNEIKDSAFAGCKALKNVYFPNNLSKIGNSAFRDCISLSNIEIPNTVTEIGAEAFQGCSGFTRIIIPQGVTSIGNGAYRYCTSVDTIEYRATLAADMTSGIGSLGTVGLTPNVALIIGANVQRIPAYIFYNCATITTVIFDRGGYYRDEPQCSSVGAYSFFGCTNIDKVYYGSTRDNWNKISFSADEYNTSENLTERIRYYYSAATPTRKGYYWHYQNGVPTIWEAWLPLETRGLSYEKVTPSGSAPYYRCTGVGNATDIENLYIAEYVDDIPVRRIAENAFAGQTKIKRITIPSMIRGIGNSAFSNCPNIEVINYNAEFLLTEPTENNKIFYSNRIYKPFVDINIGSMVQEIPSYLFSSSNNQWDENLQISSVVFEQGSVCRYIGSHAFERTRLNEFDFETPPLEFISSHAFYLVNGLINQDIKLPETLDSIARDAFAGCSINSIEIPEKCTNIAYATFNGCSNMSYIVFGSKIKTVEAFAFAGCTNLKSIYYKGTEEEWYDVNVAENNTYFKNANVYLYSQKRPPETPDGIIDDWWRYDSDGNPEVWGNLQYELSEDGATYIVTGIGTYYKSTLSIPYKYNSKVVSAIKRYAIYNVQFITSLVTKGVEIIEEGAFAGCENLSSATLSATNIGSSAMAETRELHNRAFMGCTSLRRIGLRTSGLEYIGAYVFYGCTSPLTIRTNLGEDEWNAVEKDPLWDSGIPEDTTIKYYQSI